MMIETKAGIPMDHRALKNYLRRLVDLFFKILPMRENEEPSLIEYIRSLQVELLGCSELISGLKYDAQFLTLLGILQYLIDHSDVSVDVYRREVFKAISICNSLKARYTVISNEQEG